MELERLIAFQSGRMDLFQKVYHSKKMKPLFVIRLLPGIIIFATSAFSSQASAAVGKIYHPYVEPLEKEIEFVGTRSLDEMDYYRNSYTLAYGQAITDKFFLEFAVQAEDAAKTDFDIESYELEGLYQLTEQGAGVIDYGLLIEFERETQANISEIGATLLLEKELGRSSLTANVGLVYEFGTGIDNEYDRLARLQWRYRLRPAFEPAFEIYIDEYDKAAGPAMMGLLRIAPKQKIRWELGLLFGLEEETPDKLLRAVLEYEF